METVRTIEQRLAVPECINLLLQFYPPDVVVYFDHDNFDPSWRLIVGLLMTVLSGGCSVYDPLPLNNLAISQQLRTPSHSRLAVQAAAISHPVLKPIPFAMDDGLTPDEASILAVLRNPDLRAARDQRGIADAQLLQAGLLPDPQIAYTLAAPSGGTDAGMNNAFGIGLTWEATALIWRKNKISAADHQRRSVDLDIAWQEWQTAQAAKLAAYQFIIYTRQQALLKEMAQRLEDNRIRIQQAARQGLVTELERVAAVAAKNLVDIRLQALAQQQAEQLQRLHRSIGLAPDDAVKFQQDIELTDTLHIPTYQALTRDIGKRRLDLLALQQAYASQDENLRIAVLQQFPKISIGFDHARDNSNLYTVGFGVSMSLPIFDRNRGQIALERATRKQLYDQYSTRVFQARSDIAELLVTIDAITRQISSVRQTLPDLDNLVQAYRSALLHGQADVLNYYTAWNSLTDKKIDLLTLQMQLVQAKIALEVASGLYQIDTDSAGNQS